MGKSSLELVIKNTSTQNDEEIVLCKKLLRSISHRRYVYDGSWNNQDVIVKLFSSKIHSYRHLHREWKGLQTLHSKGISSPQPFFKGETDDGQKVVVIENIVGSSTVLDALNATDDKNKQLELLILTARELAEHHNKGVIQKDLHLGNFLLKDETLFALDAGQMKFVCGCVRRKAGIKMLGMLMYPFMNDDQISINAIAKAYLQTRQWYYKTKDEHFLKRQLIRAQNRGLRHGVKKFLRTNKRHLRIKINDVVGVFDRKFIRENQPIDFIQDIDRKMDEGMILKNGNTCYVSRFMWQGKDIVVKRYNYKGFLHSIRHTIKCSRAKKCWLNGLRLQILNVATPKPFAYFEKHSGPFVQKSYFVTEYLEGVRLHDYLNDDNRSREERMKVIKKVEASLDKLGRYQITHGDLKHTNILITTTGPALTDLDAMVIHKFCLIYKLQRRKDSSRLMQRFGYPNCLESKTHLLIITNNRRRASFRQRIGIYLDNLREKGIRCNVASIPHGLLARRKLFKETEDFQGVLIHKKGLNPFDAFWLQKYSRRIIYDFDDAIMFSPKTPNRNNTSQSWRFRKSVLIADTVISGNSYLADQARRFNPNVEVIPTGLNVNNYQLRNHTNNNTKIRLVWIGSKITLQYLAEIAPALNDIGARFDNIVLRIISDAFLTLKNMEVEKCYWSLDKQAADLSTSDIGLAPLPDNPFTRGKCGFKILQYEASGLPVVASPVGVNAEYVVDGITGFHARNTSEWTDKISRLLSDPQMRQNMGLAGRTIAEKFDTKILGNQLFNLIEENLKGVNKRNSKI